MDKLFIKIFDALKAKPRWFYTILLAIIAFTIFGISKLDLNENINAVIPQSAKRDQVMRILDNSKIADQIVFMVENTADTTDLKPIKKAVRQLKNTLQSDSLVANVRNTVSAQEMMTVYDHFLEHPYLYLDDADYASLESRLTDKDIATTVRSCYKQLVSPTGMFAGKKILADPLGIAAIGLRKLEAFQIDDNIVAKNGFLFTKDNKTALLFLEPKYASKHTDTNATLIENIDTYINDLEQELGVDISYYGGTAVAVANSKQVKVDIVVTVSLSIILLLALFFTVFKRIRNILVLLFPIVLGLGLSLAIMPFLFGSISAIALSIGAVLLGISIDYSLHLFVHYRESGDVRTTLKHIAEPVIISSVTTSSAFLSLILLKSEALAQLGIFVAITIFLVALFILTLVPFLLSKLPQQKEKEGPISKAWSNFNPEPDKNKWLVILVVILTGGFTYLSQDIEFNSDISTLNFQTEELNQAEQKLLSISTQANGAMYLIAEGATLDSALLNTKEILAELNNPQISEGVLAISEVASFILTPEDQHKKIKVWNAFWDNKDRSKIEKSFIKEGAKYGINAKGFSSFFNMIAFTDESLTLASNPLQETIFKDYVMQGDSSYYLSTIIKVKAENRMELYNHFSSLPKTIVIDKSRMIASFFDSLRGNFDDMVKWSQLILFIIILLFWGRIELALITFIPIITSWIWTVGLMNLCGLEFNIFSVIVSTLIFGLGVDYSVFLVKGLQAQYTYGNVSLKSYRQSIFLSSFTTVAALGVLVFAKHPALKSIAFASIFGICSVVAIANITIPVMFRYFIGYKPKRKTSAIRIVTFYDILVSIAIFLVFLLGAIVITALIPVLIITPYNKDKKKYFFHRVIQLFYIFVCKIALSTKTEIIDKDLLNFDKPSIIVSNHQSQIDIAILLLLHPKIIVLTNQWVWNNPFYGFIVKYANYYPLTQGLDKGLDRIGDKIEKGYSVLIFPEGTRTDNGKIKRFHQGAFFLADRFNVPIQPIIINGLFELFPKTDFLLKSRKISLKVLPAFDVESVDIENNETYRKQAQALTKVYRKELEKFKHETNDCKTLYRELIHHYVYKGPILENYGRVKVKLENYYTFFDQVIPDTGKIIDIGCGYGFLPLMLKMRSDAREIIGLDYDEDKIAVAHNIATEYEKLDFKCQNIIEEKLEKTDVIILNDVLHYMPKIEQGKVLDNCFNAINSGGKMIIRDANKDNKKGTKATAFTEFMSIKFLGFNKMLYDEVDFLSGAELEAKARQSGFEVEVIKDSKLNSNTIYILDKK